MHSKPFLSPAEKCNDDIARKLDPTLRMDEISLRIFALLSVRGKYARNYIQARSKRGRAHTDVL